MVGANLVPIAVLSVSLFSKPTNKFKIVMFSIEFCLFQKRLSRDSLRNVSFRERKLSPYGILGHSQTTSKVDKITFEVFQENH